MQYAKRRGECGLTLGATLMSRERFSAIRSLRTSCLLFGKWFMRCTGLSWEFLNVISFTWCAGFVSECAQVPPPGIEGCLLLLLSVLSQRTYLAHNAVGVAPAHVPWLPRLPHTPPGPMLHRLSNHGGREEGGVQRKIHARRTLYLSGSSGAITGCPAAATAPPSPSSPVSGFGKVRRGSPC
jgi:hypothetical protein